MMQASGYLTLAAFAKWTCEHKVKKAAWAASAWLTARGNKIIRIMEECVL